jgi:gamma-glutamylputrescine oxidase
MHLTKDFNYSYWELKYYFDTYDLIVVGSGIVGLSTAISYKESHAKAKILILEKGFFPDGASTKNAGFACFGSAGELLDDLDNMPENEVWETVKMRWEGLQLLRSRLKDKNLNYRAYGGFELFRNKKEMDYCFGKLEWLNKRMLSLIGVHNCYQQEHSSISQFKKIKGALFNSYEGQLDTSLMMKNLILLAQKKGVVILNNVTVLGLEELNDTVELNSNRGVFKAKTVVLATNGFVNQLIKINDVKPARAQVLITKPLKNLKIKGTFHLQKGFYYFRNIDDRLLFGGGRNVDFENETTCESGLNAKIQQNLDDLLREIILPDTFFEVEHRWSGIMGVGKEKKPIIKAIGKNILAAVRMGGMGVAIGSLVGQKAAKEIS